MKPTFFASAEELRAWLEKNHASVPELLFGFYKKTAKPSQRSGIHFRAGITYREALDEALCFGWIDGVRKSLDAASYTIRFTPRRPGSIWSAVNIRRAQQLSQLGRMAKPGREAFAARQAARTGRYSYENRPRQLPLAYAKRFKTNPKAWSFFEAQPPGYRRMAAWYVMSAVKEETRLRRLATLIAECEKGRRLGIA